MDTVVLRRRGVVSLSDRPLQVAGYALSFVGMAALAYATSGWPAALLMGGWSIIAVGSMTVLPRRVLTADRHGISVGTGRDRRSLRWGEITQLVVSAGRGDQVSIGVRVRPGALPSRPWDRMKELQRRLFGDARLGAVRRDRPFALAFESGCTASSARELAEQFQSLAPVPVAGPGAESFAGEPYAVRARFRSGLPFAAFLVAWNGGLGTAWAIGLSREYPHALFPLILIGVGIALIVADVLIPREALRVDGTGLRFKGEFLAWNEIEAIEVAPSGDGTELGIRTTGPAAMVEPQVRRRLPGVRVDPARLTGAAPAHVTIDLTARS
ncbi:hypothetical protein [Actinomadura nitritigenes]|uniref:hypothetical protein n=1 Tax=Actinomadura nitritigenes TaxID=134602 RepID=UPI003D8BADDE